MKLGFSRIESNSSQWNRKFLNNLRITAFFTIFSGEGDICDQAQRVLKCMRPHGHGHGKDKKEDKKEELIGTEAEMVVMAAHLLGSMLQA